MNFNSPGFLFFLPVVLFLFILLHRIDRARNAILLLSSYYFYMCWDWRCAGLIALSTVVDFWVGQKLSRTEGTRSRRLLLTVSLVVNLGLLATFKYYNFFWDVAQQTFGIFGLEISSSTIQLMLPVGISFYTFQTLSYTIDLYRRQIEHEPNFIKFAVFVSFFPQLVAGPIVRACDFLPQLQQAPNVDRSRFNIGLVLIFRGLFKKIVFADLLATFAVDMVFDSPSDFSALDLYAALLGYAFQIYNDFSGYSDIAIGSASLMGFQLTKNFDRPYLAQNIREFWSRWHISLSTWLRDYLYIPLGGNRGGKLKMYRNLLVTMMLGGLWHGAAMNFIYWGAYHALLLIGSHARRNKQPTHKYKLLNRLLCFHLVLYGWLLFRIGDMERLEQYTFGLLKATLDSQLSWGYFVVLALAGCVHWLTPPSLVDNASKRTANLPSPILGVFFLILLLLYLAATLDTPSFIYFQF